MLTDKVNSHLEKVLLLSFLLPFLHNLFLNIYTQDNLIHHIVHMTHFDYSSPKLRENKMCQINLNEVQSS